MADDTPQTPAGSRPHTNPANGQPRVVRSTGTGRSRHRTTEVMADLPQGAMQPESNDVKSPPPSSPWSSNAESAQ